MDLRREFIELQLDGLRMIWGSYFRLFDAFIGKGYGAKLQPHERAEIKRMADQTIDRYFQTLEVFASYQNMMGLWKIDGPEQPKRIPIAIEDKTQIIPVKIIKKKKDDDKRESA